MSKRAEELADRIEREYMIASAYEFDHNGVSKLLDAELRKERERCADRAAEHALGQRWISDSANGDGIALRAAILSEDDK